MTPTEIRALADRVREDKDASRELVDEVLRAFGWILDDDIWYISEVSARYQAEPKYERWFNPLLSIDAANALVPKGWWVKSIYRTDASREVMCDLHNGPDTTGMSDFVLSNPSIDIPHGITAAALLALAHGKENGK